MFILGGHYDFFFSLLGFAETDALSVCSTEAGEQPMSATQEGGFVAGEWCASATVG